MQQETITQGEHVEMELELTDEDTGRPFDLTDFDEFKVCFKIKGGTLELTETEDANGLVEILGGVADSKLGILLVTIKPAGTTQLEAKNNQEIDIELNKSSVVPAEPKRKRLKDILNVDESNCS